MSGEFSNACRLDGCELNNGVISLSWDDGHTAEFHSIWLRDNCRCAACGEPSTGRRTSRLTALPCELAVTSAALDPEGDLSISWSDDHDSQFSASWLRQHAYDKFSRQGRCFSPSLWTHELRASPPEMDFAIVDGDASEFLNMLQTVRDYGICFLRDAPAEPGRLEPFARKVGPIQENNFGLVQDLVVDHTRQSVANRTHALKAHTDEPYRASPPGLLMFHCIETDVTGGGSSIFIDGFEAAELVRQEDPEGFAALTSNNQPFRRHFADDVDLIAEFPVLSVNAFGNLSGVRVNDRVAAPLNIPGGEVEVYYRGLRRLLQLAEDETLMIKRTLRPGDIAIFDNHRILHGRTELTMNGRRFLQWLQVERGDFHSSLRIMADRLQQPRDLLPLLRGAY